MKRIAVFLTENQIARLRKLAQAVGVPMAEMLRRLLDDALNRLESKQ